MNTETWEAVRPIHAIAVACAPDSRLMAELIESGVRLVELTTGEEIAFLERPDFENMSGVAFSPDGTSLLVQHLKRGIEIWDLRMIREQLKEMNLDWKWPEFPPDPSGNPASTPAIRLRLHDESARF